MRVAIRIGAIMLFAAPLLAQAQSQRQLADRHVKQSVVSTIDERKGERTIRMVTTTYDHKGNPTELVERDEQGRMLRWEKHVYDRKGRELMSADLDSAGTEVKRIETTRDRWGNETASCTWSRGAIKERTESRYDANGDKVEEVATDANGKRVRRTTYAYEHRGLIERRTVYDADGNMVYDRTSTYTY